MHPADFEDFTRELVSHLARDERVVGLVALGSTAATGRRPDEWSDHDIWIVTQDGGAAAVRSDLTWLPRSEEVVVWFAETVHGRSAIYSDGHLVEYAVFDLGELHIARTNAYRVLYDDCDLESQMSSMKTLTSAEAPTLEQNGDNRFGALLAQLTIGTTRFARGERLSAHQMIRGRAVHTLTDLLALSVDVDELDSLDSSRRFERIAPQLAADIERAIELPLLDGVEALVDIARRELAEQLTSATPKAFAALDSTVSRARVAVDPNYSSTT